MKKFLIATLAATVLAAPLAHAQDPYHRPPPHNAPYHQPPHHEPPRHVQHYPKGWGPNHVPDRPGYYRGYRGYHDHRPGYKRAKDGYWYPAAAFTVGALIGGMLAQ